MDENTGNDTPTETVRDYEAEARDMGHIPKEEFKGNPDQWVDAKTFVERGEKFLPIVKSQLKQSEGKVTELQQKLSDVENQLKSQSEKMTANFKRELEIQQKMTQHALEVQKQNLENHYEGLKRQAVEDGDLEEFDRLSAEHKEQEKRFEEPKFEQDVNNELKEPEDKQENKSQDKISQEQQKVIDTWKSENTWYDDNEEMREYAAFVNARYINANPDTTLEKSLEVTLERVKTAFPDQFQEQKQNSHMAGGSRNMNGGGNRTKGWADMSAEAQQNSQFFIQNGTYKDQAEAAKHYWSLNND